MATSGKKGRFLDRLKKIASFRRKKTVIEKKDELIEDSYKIYTNFLKVVAAIPGLVYDNVVNNDLSDKNVSHNNQFENRESKPFRSNQKSYLEDNNSKVYIENSISKKELRKNFFNIQKKGLNKNETRKPILKQNVSKEIRAKTEKRQIFITVDEIQRKKKISSVVPTIDVEANNRVKELEKSIINLIKKDLIRIVNEMEILQSELYILSEVNGESKVLKDCQRELDNVKAMICKIDKLKEQYDFLKDNYDFEYLLEVNNEDIVDKIIELRNSFGKSEVKSLADDYKLLEVYQHLYLKIDELQEKAIIYEDEKEKELQQLKERDINFEKLKQNVYNVDYTNRNYDEFVNDQNNILRQIDENVSKINSYESVDYHFKGFHKLFLNSFKYFGLLMVSPLKGIIPSIATETLITRNMIKNLYRNLEIEEERKVVYEAMDYSNIISSAINDLDSTSNIVDATLDDIVHLKMKYNDQFKKYQGDFYEYRDIMHKINDMENKILGNKIKIEIMKKRALEQQKANENKLKLVRQLNEKK